MNIGKGFFEPLLNNDKKYIERYKRSKSIRTFYNSLLKTGNIYYIYEKLMITQYNNDYIMLYNNFDSAVMGLVQYKYTAWPYWDGSKFYLMVMEFNKDKQVPEYVMFIDDTTGLIGWPGEKEKEVKRVVLKGELVEFKQREKKKGSESGVIKKYR